MQGLRSPGVEAGQRCQSGSQMSGPGARSSSLPGGVGALEEARIGRGVGGGAWARAAFGEPGARAGSPAARKVEAVTCGSAPIPFALWFDGMLGSGVLGLRGRAGVRRREGVNGLA